MAVLFIIIRANNMEWTEEHDLQLLIEMRASNVFSFKKGSPERGRIWERITDTLNSEKTLKFCLKDKRGVRDRWNLLQGKFKRKRREEEGGSGLAVDEPSQKDVLIEELCELEDAVLQSATVKNHDKKVAEDTRQKAMERLGETKKRKKEGDGVGELQVKKTRRSTSDAVGFLSEKMKVEQTFHQEELALKRKEQEILSQAQQHNQQQQHLLLQQMQEQNRRMQAMHEQSLQQQQQQHQMLMGLLQKLITRQ